MTGSPFRANLHRVAAALMVLGGCALCRHAAAEPIRFEALFPAAVAPGTTTAVTLVGSFPRWPLRVAACRSGIRIEPGEKKGTCRVTVSSDAPPGPVWVRLFDDQGATPRRMLLVVPGPRVREKESNDGLEEAQQVALPTYIDGRLQRGGDVDTYRVKLASGNRIVAQIASAFWFDAAVDCVLQLTDDRGNIIAQNDDERGLDPLLVHRVKRDGTYFVRVFGFPRTPNSSIAFAGNAAYVYQLLLSTGEVLDHAVPLAVPRDAATSLRLVGWNLAESARTLQISPSSDSRWHWIAAPHGLGVFPVEIMQRRVNTVAPSGDASDPATVSLPMTATCRFERPREVRAVAVSLKKGQAVRIVAASERVGLRVDPVLAVLDAQGKQLKEFDDSSRAPDIEATWRVPADGVYRFVLRDRFGHAGLRYVARWHMALVEPAFALNVAKEYIEVEAGKSVKVDVAVDRIGGFDHSIEVAARGLSDGVTCAAARSEPKGSAAKKVTIEFQAASDAQSGVFEIVGSARGEEAAEASTVSAEAGDAPPFAPRKRFWLQVVKKK